MEDHADWYSEERATFGDRVAGAREAVGLTQTELARKLGVKVKTVRGWEDDLSEPRANKLQMLSGLLGVSLMWLLNGEGEGVDAPDTQAVLGADVKSLLGELREIRAEMDRATDKLARTEKRLRGVLAEIEG
ncbi:helix-turn-helix domain-containing protein [Actibacterium sp. 188UL27-1]|uniref:helix-turn-helix domain-containing protein n=1 Tax=Actibacterium sp. 188UL27-1 TaxID=2786961 RepID=UPI001959112B|nr:helix-turn-helix domain-containing protein [Actibacterium sp. 188UL27-1]MBM7066873.1 helix-turn-helix domain-containing protein [Actibacterium sp. 188UL27-1]